MHTIYYFFNKQNSSNINEFILPVCVCACVCACACVRAHVTTSVDCVPSGVCTSGCIFNWFPFMFSFCRLFDAGGQHH